MTELLDVLLARGDGVVTTPEMTRAGFDVHDVRRVVAAGRLLRVRNGAYVDQLRWAASDPTGRHALEVRAVLRRLDAHVACSVSAAVLTGLPVVAKDLGHWHVARVGSGHGRRSGRLWVHPAVERSDVRTLDGVGVVRPELSVLQVAAMSVRAGLMAADAAVRRGVRVNDLVHEALVRQLGPNARRVAGLANGLAESPGESWTRLLLVSLGIQAEQQAELRDRDGRFVAWVDFLIRSRRLVVEFDGAVKYAGADGREALVREKRREDRIRALGYRVVRLTWADLEDPRRLVALLDQAA